MNIEIGSELQVKVPLAQVSAAPTTSAQCTNEALYGEQLTLLELHRDWGLVRQNRDGYQGFMRLGELESYLVATRTTHWVTERSTLLFYQADFKSSIAHRIPFASEVSLTPIKNSPFSRTACGYFIWNDHCQDLEQRHALDPISLATSIFRGAPYRWGGRSPQGTDCSGLIQQLARSQGISIPRDSGDQELFISQEVAPSEYQSNDIVYWPGHTGILLDKTLLLHATAFRLSCIVESLDTVVQRAGPVSSVRRLFP